MFGGMPKEGFQLQGIKLCFCSLVETLMHNEPCNKDHHTIGHASTVPIWYLIYYCNSAVLQRAITLKGAAGLPIFWSAKEKIFTCRLVNSDKSAQDRGLSGGI